MKIWDLVNCPNVMWNSGTLISDDFLSDRSLLLVRSIKGVCVSDKM